MTVNWFASLEKLKEEPNLLVIQMLTIQKQSIENCFKLKKLYHNKSSSYENTSNYLFYAADCRLGLAHQHWMTADEFVDVFEHCKEPVMEIFWRNEMN